MGIVSLVANMGIQYLDVDPVDATVLALDLGITTYDSQEERSPTEPREGRERDDAAYLWLAREHQAGLVTLDGDFAKAAARVLPPSRLLPHKH